MSTLCSVRAFKKFVVRMIQLCLLSNCAVGQTATVPSQEKEDVKGRISAFSRCLQSRKAGCIAESISSRGVTLGVDGPRITKDSLVRQLLRDHAMQCLFWANHCSSTTTCSVLNEITKLNGGRMGEPRLYGKHWQVDAESKPSGTCKTGLPFVFQLEDGYWRLVAIPYS